MRIRSLLLFAVVLGFFSTCAPLVAHHGIAAFDVDKELTLKGTVTDWFWANPHCLLQFDVTGDDGKVVHWIAETQAPASMIHGGWSKQSFKPGDVVTVILNPVKNGKPLGQIKQVTLPNGTTLIAIR